MPVSGVGVRAPQRSVLLQERAGGRDGALGQPHDHGERLNGPSPSGWANVHVTAGSSTVPHGRPLPEGPAKQAACVGSAGS